MYVREYKFPIQPALPNQMFRSKVIFKLNFNDEKNPYLFILTHYLLHFSTCLLIINLSKSDENSRHIVKHISVYTFWLSYAAIMRNLINYLHLVVDFPKQQ